MEHEVRLREIDLASQPKVVKSDNPQFDASKNIKLVPNFIEKNVDKYFQNFPDDGLIRQVCKAPYEDFLHTDYQLLTVYIVL